MKLNTKYMEKITDVIERVQKGRLHSIIDYDDIIYSIKEIEDRLSTLLRRKHWIGLRFLVDKHFKNFMVRYSDGYIPGTTQFIIERRTSGWFLMYLSLDFCSQYYIKPLNLENKTNELFYFLNSNFA